VSGLLPNITYACFGLSYLCALVLELTRLRWPWPSLRYAALAFGAAGLFAHTAYLLYHQPDASTPSGSLLSVAWVLAIFGLYGSLHHTRQAWAVFVLPVVLGLVGLSLFMTTDLPATGTLAMPTWLISDRFWGAMHGMFLLFAAVGISVGFLASVMYLIQASRLRAKANPLVGIELLSLERLEEMNRRAINLAFPMLTVGLLLGGVLLRQYHDLAENWLSVKVLGTIGLWLVFLVLLYLRYATHVPGRRLARLTLLVFAIMVLVLASAHPFATGGGK